MHKYLFLIFGTLFGFLLSRAGATTYDYYAKLFLFQDFQLVWVMGTAVILGILGIGFMKRTKVQSVFLRAPIAFDKKPYRPELIPGSLLFGVGWGLAAACPGTVLAMLGEGKLAAIFPILGMGLGTYLYGLNAAKSRKSEGVETRQVAEAG